jgi:hypothetical protein
MGSFDCFANYTTKITRSKNDVVKKSVKINENSGFYASFKDVSFLHPVVHANDEN